MPYDDRAESVLRARFGVQGIPTLLVFRDGQLVDRAVGARGADQLQAWIEGLIPRPR